MAQGVGVEFGDDEAAVAAEAAAGHPGRFDDLLDAALTSALSLASEAVRRTLQLIWRAIGPGLFGHQQARQQRIVGEFVEIEEFKAGRQVLLQAGRARAGIDDDRPGTAAVVGGRQQRRRRLLDMASASSGGPCWPASGRSTFVEAFRGRGEAGPDRGVP